jgi:hypothetical protein
MGLLSTWVAEKSLYKLQVVTGVRPWASQYKLQEWRQQRGERGDMGRDTQFLASHASGWLVHAVHEQCNNRLAGNLTGRVSFIAQDRAIVH